MCTEIETLAEFLLPCCMAAGCSPATNQSTEFNQMPYLVVCETVVGYFALSSDYVSEESPCAFSLGNRDAVKL
jgi:hypothetical protein